MKNIRTRSDFENVAESWFQRLHWLREYYFDETKPKEKRIRAISLWSKMVSRMGIITQIAIKLRTPKPSNYPSGGYSEPYYKNQ